MAVKYIYFQRLTPPLRFKYCIGILSFNQHLKKIFFYLLPQFLRILFAYCSQACQLFAPVPSHATQLCPSPKGIGT